MHCRLILIDLGLKALHAGTVSLLRLVIKQHDHICVLRFLPQGSASRIREGHLKHKTVSCSQTGFPWLRTLSCYHPRLFQ